MAVGRVLIHIQHHFESVASSLLDFRYITILCPSKRDLRQLPSNFILVSKIHVWNSDSNLHYSNNSNGDSSGKDMYRCELAKRLQIKCFGHYLHQFVSLLWRTGTNLRCLLLAFPQFLTTDYQESKRKRKQRMP